VLVAHWDGYSGNTNNFFVYVPSVGDRRMRFIPWGVDGTFAPSVGGLLATGALPERLIRHPLGRARYVAELRRLLDEVWDEARYIDLIARWDALTFAAREADNGPAGSADVAALKVFVAERRRTLLTALAALPSPPPLRGPPCATGAGVVSGSFATRWHTFAIEDPFTTGSGTLDVASDAFPPLTFGAVGAKIGVDREGPADAARLLVLARVLGAGHVALLIDIARPLAPSSHALGSEAQALVFYLEPAGGAQLIGFLGDGELVLERAGELVDAGDARPSPIEGYFAGVLYGFF
jgi:hypothetical protein